MVKCKHFKGLKKVEPLSLVCGDCIKKGDSWVHLRTCLICGYVGCCDNSKNKHATKHYKKTKHPLIKSIEFGENWTWCYPDELFFE